ncbi:MAG: hypothetical protein ACTHMF_00645 [Leifsonia sp.]|uniref:hypothetical protein n=1 Tax=Leifsonia sp. TaxID=1870902 RepID=UPI003F7EABC4
MGSTFADAARQAALRGAREAVVAAPGLAHRELMRRVKTLVSVALAAPEDAPAGTVAAAEALVAELAGLQSGSGLFEGGDNVQSPPDSAFTINDACDVHHLLRDADAALVPLREALAAVIRAAAPALLAGGVHTPNHRWELSAALARIHRSFPDDRLVARVDEWLAEGVDIDADGWFSERSPNYAAAVSIPSLTAIADILDRPALRAAVLRNLELTLSLIGADGAVETLASRRQDQGTRFPLGRYAVAFRRAAIDTVRGDLAWAAERAVRDGVDDAGVLAELLLDPSLADALPPSEAPAFPETIVHPTVALAVRRGSAAEVVVYGGSDYARHRGIRSGLANDPTFLRLLAGEAVLDSVRLSRTFFGLGPFRAEGLEAAADGSLLLGERVAAGYYQPLPAERRDAGGDYALTDDGRFSAAMAFGERAVDEVELRTTIAVRPRDDGADLDVAIEGPRVGFSIELAFRTGGVLDVPGPRPEDGAFVLTGPIARYTAGGDAIRVEVDGLDPVAHPIAYAPGEDYAYLGGTDQADGVRLLIGGATPARFRLRLRAERGAAS